MFRKTRVLLLTTSCILFYGCSDTNNYNNQNEIEPENPSEPISLSSNNKLNGLIPANSKIENQVEIETTVKDTLGFEHSDAFIEIYNGRWEGSSSLDNTSGGARATILKSGVFIVDIGEQPSSFIRVNRMLEETDLQYTMSGVYSSFNGEDDVIVRMRRNPREILLYIESDNSDVNLGTVTLTRSSLRNKLTVEKLVNATLVKEQIKQDSDTWIDDKRNFVAYDKDCILSSSLMDSPLNQGVIDVVAKVGGSCKSAALGEFYGVMRFNDTSDIELLAVPLNNSTVQNITIKMEEIYNGGFLNAL